jgi:paraquat-inducible protein B
MSKRKDSAVIGVFVIGALVLVVAAILLWGSGRLFRTTAEVVCYFEGSVNGLEVGAPVKARGVPIGKVARIQLRHRQRPDDYRIPVFIALDLHRLVDLGVEDPTPQTLRDYIARGLRARLESQSIITGALYVNLQRFPGSPIVLSQVGPPGEYPEIPTMPTQLAEVSKSLTAILSKLQAVDFAAFISTLESAGGSIDRLASAEHLPRALKEATATLQSYRRLADNLNAGVPPLLAQVQAATGDARTTIAGLDGAAERLIAPQAPLSVRLNEGLADVSRAANAVRELAEYLRRNPNALLVGKSR